MKRCDPNARAKCPERESCELYAEFVEGSWCDDFNEKLLNRPMTNADRIRAMSDRELLSFLVKHDVEQNRMRLESNGIVPTATQLSVLRNSLRGVWWNWLRQPAEEGNA